MTVQYFTGALPDEADERDKELDHVLAVGEPFDWEEGFDIEEEIGMIIPVKDQGRTSTCTGQAMSTYVWVKNVLEYTKRYGELDDSMKEYLVKWLVSAKAIYSQIFLQQGGAYLRDAIKLIKDWGAVSEQLVPFKPDEQDARDLSWKNSIMDESAKILQAAEYRVVQNPTIDKLAQAIRDNDGMLLGVAGENNGTWRTLFPKVGKSEWGHAIYGGKAKMIDGKKMIGFLNSWGETTGDRGWQWVGEEWFGVGRLFNPWLLVDKQNSSIIWLIDRNGKPRWMPSLFLKTILYLVNKRGFKLK